jgi:hypothetical protein
MTFKAGEEYALKLSQLAAGGEEIAKKAVYAAADIVTDKIRENLKANLAGSERSSGALEASLGITPIQSDKDGFINAKVGFDGYDGKGVPNQLKARVMESGSSAVRKRPFVRPAVNATKKAAVEAMQQVIDEETKKIMKG